LIPLFGFIYQIMEYIAVFKYEDEKPDSLGIRFTKVKPEADTAPGVSCILAEPLNMEESKKTLLLEFLNITSPSVSKERYKISIDVFKKLIALVSGSAAIIGRPVPPTMVVKAVEAVEPIKVIVGPQNVVIVPTEQPKTDVMAAFSRDETNQKEQMRYSSYRALITGLELKHKIGSSTWTMRATPVGFDVYEKVNGQQITQVNPPEQYPNPTKVVAAHGATLNREKDKSNPIDVLRLASDNSILRTYITDRRP
jgi:hypothetical protein